jgi:hypothetical protein
MMILTTCGFHMLSPSTWNSKLLVRAGCWTFMQMASIWWSCSTHPRETRSPACVLDHFWIMFGMVDTPRVELRTSPKSDRHRGAGPTDKNCIHIIHSDISSIFKYKLL